MERGRCSGLVYATPTLTQILLVLLSCTPGTLTKSLPGTLKARALLVAWFQPVSVRSQCDSEQLPATGSGNFRQAGMVTEVLGSSGVTVVVFVASLPQHPRV